MTEPAARFLTAMAQALSTMVLYAEGHPARDRATGRAYDHLLRLFETDPTPRFSFVGADVILGARVLRDLGEWDWGRRLGGAGIQRLELDLGATRAEFDDFLADAHARLTMGQLDTAVARQERAQHIRIGQLGVEGRALEEAGSAPVLGPTAAGFTFADEADAVRWMHDEVQRRGELPLMEAEAVVRSLSLAMRGGQEMLIPLLQLKDYDQYTTTHSLNVSVLAMALAEFMGLGSADVRAFGVAGLLHDIGKVRIPREILNKPGKLDDRELQVMRRHPVDGAKIIIESDRRLDLASVVAYEHHIMLNGGGYPGFRFRRPTHQASKLVHVCDVYDALRTNRPYREAWESERVLAHIERGAGPDFDPEVVRAFTAMVRRWEQRVTVVESETQAFGTRRAPPPPSPPVVQVPG